MQTTKEKIRYKEAIGRRKTAIARVRIYPSTNKPIKEIESFDVTVNEIPAQEYFKIERLRKVATAPFVTLNTSFKTTVKVQGGGPSSQAEAVRLGIARALNDLNEKWHTPLKAAGFLKRDSRAVERKKPGQPKARRRFQHSKR